MLSISEISRAHDTKLTRVIPEHLFNSTYVRKMEPHLCMIASESLFVCFLSCFGYCCSSSRVIFKGVLISAE